MLLSEKFGRGLQEWNVLNMDYIRDIYGKYNEVLRLQPPLTLTEDEAHWAAKIIKR